MKCLLFFQDQTDHILPKSYIRNIMVKNAYSLLSIHFLLKGNKGDRYLHFFATILFVTFLSAKLLIYR